MSAVGGIVVGVTKGVSIVTYMGVGTVVAADSVAPGWEVVPSEEFGEDAGFGGATHALATTRKIITRGKILLNPNSIKEYCGQGYLTLYPRIKALTIISPYLGA